jgi:hypothetical protein
LSLEIALSWVQRRREERAARRRQRLERRTAIRARDVDELGVGDARSASSLPPPRPAATAAATEPDARATDNLSNERDHERRDDERERRPLDRGAHASDRLD